MLKKELGETSSLAQAVPISELKRAPKGWLKMAVLLCLFHTAGQKKMTEEKEE